MENNEKITYMDEQKLQLERNGKVVDCDILFTFNSDDTMRSYIGYTDHSIAKNGRKNIFVCSYDPFDPEVHLENITDKREQAMVHDVLQQIYKESQAKK